MQKFTQRIVLALAVCFALVLLPIAAQSQEGVIDKTGQGIKKGAGAVKEGAETTVDKTKEGVEYVGEGAKDAVTDEDQQKQDDTKADRQKPAESTMPSEKSESSTDAENKDLPATAGELPILALLGALAMGGSLTSRFIRRVK